MTVIAVNGLLKTQQQWAQPTQGAPLTRVLILNLMPTKLTTERQFLTQFAHLTTDVEVTFMYPVSHHFKSIPRATVAENYVTLTDIAAQHFDGLIVTGAPVEQLPFEAVDYWSEFQTIIDWAQTHVTQTLFECWAAQAGLYAQFKIKKQLVAQKVFGIYTATAVDQASQLVTGLSAGGLLKMPQSRQSRLDLPHHLPADLQVVATNRQVGPLILTAATKHAVYVTGHPEYETDTLANEYFRDRRKHRPINLPQHYFVDQSLKQVRNSWQAASGQFYQNWLETLKLTKVGL
ncbi:homoserine O-succinyltransferase [Lactiplantibacillus sp. WILCCON 0030]|uniref:Homoserine O-acetyltransferase n=1 Tax=Lactiplantibacillus brownii TaxID=3069269 RepID=A0ABU1AAB9_9LACO|nr:homoserine O-succinyltransferase [Lactiplantibacillus brownii]MDQ7937879.1 homoserine O-succinyltransferase [Lactiplantibacillus brownii]